MYRAKLFTIAGVVVCLVVLGRMASGDRARAADPVANPTAGEDGPDVAGWTSDFSAEKSTLVATGRNPYFILEPGYVLVLEGGGERLVITVLDQTRTIDGVETRVV